MHESQRTPTTPIVRDTTAADRSGDAAPEQRQRRLAGWAGTLLALVIALAAAGTIIMLHDRSTDSLRTQRLLGDLQGQASRQSALVDRAIAARQLGLDGVQELQAARGELIDVLAEVVRLAPGAEAPALREAFQTHQVAVDDAVRLLAAGQFAPAQAVDEERVDPSFDLLRGTITVTSDWYGARARRTDRLADLGTVVSLAAAALLVSLLYRRWRREQTRFERMLTYQGFHDLLTTLPNRALFADRLGQALARAVRGQETVGVLLLDLDGFKAINDSLGYGAGDQLLVAVARRLDACVRIEDSVGRLGGDEFIILLERLANESDAVRVAERIMQVFEEAFVIAGREVFINGHIGIALASQVAGTRQPAGQQGADDLLRQADAALHRAKGGGEVRYAVFDPDLNAYALARLELEADLRGATERGEFVVHYQPRVALATGRIVGTEALVRWAHPQQGLVAPAQFIPTADETGLIVPIGRWVLAEACRQGRAWQEEFPGDPPLTVHVNLSARQFQHSELVKDVARTLQETGLDPHSLMLEITEGVLMTDAEASIVTLKKLRDVGVQLAIDDFGTGYSSLGYLKRFPVDILKIDRSFVDGLGTDPEDTAIVEAVITLARTLGLVATAEGVETAEQLANLRALDCELGQGYYFAKPLPAAAAGALLGQSTYGLTAGSPVGGAAGHP